MEFLSTSEAQLLNEFQERVRMSEKRRKEFAEQTGTPNDPSTPQMLPYINNNYGDVSKSFESQGYGDANNERIMIHDMSPNNGQRRPQKQLQAVIFNSIISIPNQVVYYLRKPYSRF